MIRVYWHVCLPAARPAASLTMSTFMTSWTTSCGPLTVRNAENLAEILDVASSDVPSVVCGPMRISQLR